MEKTIAEDTGYYDFLSPKSFVEAGLEEIWHCGVSWKKAEYIKTIAQKTVDDEFNPESLSSLSNEQIAVTLTKFRGVGTWTTEMVHVSRLEEKCHSSRR